MPHEGDFDFTACWSTLAGMPSGAPLSHVVTLWCQPQSARSQSQVHTRREATLGPCTGMAALLALRGYPCTSDTACTACRFHRPDLRQGTGKRTRSVNWLCLVI
jgi:hypothetical protein